MRGPFSGRKESVAVVIPARDRAATLARAVESCQRQTRRVDEIVIVDDASTDATPRLVRSLSGSDARIRYIRLPEHSGAQAARRQGVLATSCDWIVFLDSDDELTENSVQARLAASAACGLDPGIVYGDVLDAAGSSRRLIRFERRSGMVFRRILKELSFAWLGTFMVKREAFRAAGYPDDALCALHGVDIALTVSRAHPVVHCGEPVLVRYAETSGIMSQPAKALAAYRYLVKKYRPDMLRELGSRGYALWKLRLLQQRVRQKGRESGDRSLVWRTLNGALARFLKVYFRAV